MTITNKRPDAAAVADSVTRIRTIVLFDLLRRRGEPVSLEEAGRIVGELYSKRTGEAS